MFPFSSSVSVISSFYCIIVYFSVAVPNTFSSVQLLHKKGESSAITFLTDATEQSVRATMTPCEEARITRIQKEKEALCNNISNQE